MIGHLVAPQISNTNGDVVKLIRWKSQKGVSAGYFEVNADHLVDRSPLNNHGTRSRSRDARVGRSVVTEMNHQFYGAHRKYAFFRAGHIVAFAVPQELDEIRKRPSRLAVLKHHRQRRPPLIIFLFL